MVYDHKWLEYGAAVVRKEQPLPALCLIIRGS